jgi:hypothetical protein
VKPNLPNLAILQSRHIKQILISHYNDVRGVRMHLENIQDYDLELYVGHHYNMSTSNYSSWDRTLEMSLLY